MARKRVMLRRYEQLDAETQRYWEEIAPRTYDFTKRERVASILSKVTIDDVLSLYDRYLAPNGPDRAKITIWAHGRSHKESSDRAYDPGPTVVLPAKRGSSRSTIAGDATAAGTTRVCGQSEASHRRNIAGKSQCDEPGYSVAKKTRDLGLTPERTGSVVRVSRDLVIIQDHNVFRRSMPLFPAPTPWEVEIGPGLSVRREREVLIGPPNGFLDGPVKP